MTAMRLRSGTISCSSRALTIQLSRHKRDTGRVKERMRQVSRNAKADPVGAEPLDSRNRAIGTYNAFGRCGMRHNNIDMPSFQFAHQCRKSIERIIPTK